VGGGKKKKNNLKNPRCPEMEGGKKVSRRFLVGDKEGDLSRTGKQVRRRREKMTPLCLVLTDPGRTRRFYLRMSFRDYLFGKGKKCLERV